MSTTIAPRSMVTMETARVGDPLPNGSPSGTSTPSGMTEAMSLCIRNELIGVPTDVAIFTSSSESRSMAGFVSKRIIVNNTQILKLSRYVSKGVKLK